MINPKKILIVIQRSNGDVFLSISLIKKIYDYYDAPQIDLLVNDDTYELAKLLPHINSIHTFSYKRKANNRFIQEVELLLKIFRRYDLSINLTSSDRSVLYAILASKKSISVIESDYKKSWWKQKLLTNFYFYDNTKHILIQNLTPLSILGIDRDNSLKSIDIKTSVFISIQNKLDKEEIKEFVIFHPSAQYKYKIFPKHLRDELLLDLCNSGFSVVVTGSMNKIDLEIKNELPSYKNLYDFIGEISLEEYFALSQLSLAYIGMDTLNMHIAAAQNKRVFAIFGPTNLKMWSPWCSNLKISSITNMPLQTYGNITIFQANMNCVACGRAGCDDSGVSKCLYNISPQLISDEFSNWYKNAVI